MLQSGSKLPSGAKREKSISWFPASFQSVSNEYKEAYMIVNFNWWLIPLYETS
jgi:hypothetical protein